MEDAWKAMVWQQLGAAIDMLENGIAACPAGLWGDRSRRPEYWYLAFHTLFWLDVHLSGGADRFAPPPPFGLEELDPSGILPDRPYSQQELRGYLEHCRRKCRATIGALTEERAAERCRFPWGEVSFAELLLYAMRHVQHHAAQLYLLLRLGVDSAPRWVARAVP